MMKNLLLTVILLAPILGYGQGDQTIINVPINAGGTSTFQAILHLPDDYGTTTTAYPIMLFFHGLGEGGANPASIYTSPTAGGPAYFIAQGTFPSSFVNPKDGKSYKFIVVSPQANPQGVEGSTTAQELDYILTYLYAHYRIDTTRVYLTGLSDGGETVVEYVGGDMTNGGNFTRFQKTHHIAAIIPMSENASAALFQEEADSIVADNIYSWGFGSTDTQGQNTLQLAWYCNQLKAGTMITTSYSGGHCCWGQFYNPTFTQNGMNIYQWALQYTHGVSAPPATTPTANAGSAQTIQLPTSQATLSGSASTVTNGTIARYAWSQQSGPSTAVIAAPGSVSTVVSGLSAGVYVFALQITDNTGKTSTATVQVTVNAAVSSSAPVVPSIPGKIEAENYTSMYGVKTQTTGDTGGGLNVGWINLGSWMDYLVNVAAAGTYTVNFRVAAPSAGGILLLKSDSGTVLATVPIPATGSYQIWATISAVITLPAGTQTLQVYSSTATNWNINWMQFLAGDAIQPIPGKIEAEDYSSMNGIHTQTTTDTGGGLNVGWINLGSWMDYSVNVAAAGNYTVDFRIAAVSAGGTLLLKSGSGAILATVPIPSTGSFQIWKTISAPVTLAAGPQTLQVYSSTAVNWNINWMQFIDSAGVSDAAAESLTLDNATTFGLYPNPVQSNFTVNVSNTYTGKLLIQVIDASGIVRQVQTLQKDQPSMFINMSARDLPAGVYFVRAQIGKWVRVKKLLKQ